METKSHYVLVGAVTLLLLAVLAGFTVWLSRIGDGAKTEYDIFFQQSVSGIAKGSGVTFAGVPVGQVKDIKLWRPDPDFVRVRIAIDSDTAILQGTTATMMAQLKARQRSYVQQKIRRASVPLDDLSSLQSRGLLARF
jgi:phospholipid/cholesterol/gamma-HCH transport system substrate-binding protein